MTSRSFRNTSECRWCKTDLFSHRSRIITAKDWSLGSTELYTYVKCSCCGSWTLINNPVEEELYLYYPSNYTPYITAVESMQALPYPREVLERLGSSEASSVRVLDYGCGSGIWLARAARTFKNCSLIAVDFDPDGAKSRIRWTKEDIQVISPREFMEDAQEYDVINFGHSIEHVPNPIDVVSAAASRLSSRGVMSIACPVSDSLSLGAFGSFWEALDAPRHLSIPSIRALKRTLEANSLQITKAESYGSPVVLDRSINYARKNSCNQRQLLRKIVGYGAKSDLVVRLVRGLNRSSKYRVFAEQNNAKSSSA